jgi:hypothetical protein
MSQQDLIVFDTSTLPEYYNDVHTILALPEGHVVTYDYSVKHVSSNAIDILRARVSVESEVRVVLAYAQSPDYNKGEGTNDDKPFEVPVFATLTRLSRIVAVREVKNDDGARYYIDLHLLGYPFDPGRAIATRIVEKLRQSGSIPMRTYISVLPDTALDVLFAQRADEQAFSQVVDALSCFQASLRKTHFGGYEK